MTANISFEKITIPASVLTIGDEAIRYIKDITFLGSAPEMTEKFRLEPMMPDPITRSWADVDNVFYPTIHYPEGDTSWDRYINDEELYNVTWVPYEVENPRTPISECICTLEQQEYVYNGSTREPAVTVTHNDAVLSSPEDYTLTYENNVNAGVASVTVTGHGEFTGSVTLTFTIAPLDSVLSFQYASMTKEADAEPFSNPLTIISDGAVVYSSSNENIATVDRSTGLVTIVGEGTAAITASCVNTVNYRSAQLSYSLTVLPKEETQDLPEFYDIAYSFSNSARSFGYGTGYKIPLERYKMFFPDIKAQDLYANRGYWGGSCFGMSTTAGMLSTKGSVLELADYGVNNIRKISVNTPGPFNLNAREIIESGQASWGAGNMFASLNHYVDELDLICRAVENSKITGEPVVMCIYGASGSAQSGHAVVALDLVQVSNTKARMYVYDCNYPNDSERYIELTKNTSGAYTSWRYNISTQKTWGTAYPMDMITCLPYDIYNAAWRNRNAPQNLNTLKVFSENYEVRDHSGACVAVMKNGKFTSKSNSVYIMYEPTLSDSTNYTICMPTAYYEVVTTDGSPIRAVMTNNAQSSVVETSATAVSFAVSDADEYNVTHILVNEGENYTVNLFSELDSAAGMEDLLFAGDGDGTMITVGLEAGELVMDGCPGVSLWINGVMVSTSETADQNIIQNCDISLSYTVTGYTGEAHQPEVTVANGELVLLKDVDYQVVYDSNIEIGTATVGVFGIGAYSGEAFLNFNIVNIEGACDNGHFWDRGLYMPDENGINGIIHYTCTVCGEQSEETVTGHTFELTALSNEYVNVRLTNRMSGYINGLMCVTVLDSDGKLLGISVQEIMLASSNSSGLLVDYEGEAAQVKAFVVDSDTLIPLGPVWQTGLQ